MDLWQRKPTLSSGYALGLGRFTAINPWLPCYNYYVQHYDIIVVRKTKKTFEVCAPDPFPGGPLLGGGVWERDLRVHVRKVKVSTSTICVSSVPLSVNVNAIRNVQTQLKSTVAHIYAGLRFPGRGYTSTCTRTTLIFVIDTLMYMYNGQCALF